MSAVDFAARSLATRSRSAWDITSALAVPRDRVKRIAIIGDSFAGGAGVGNPLTFGIPFAAAMRAKFGDAGAGYIPFNDGRMAGISKAGYAIVERTGPGTDLFRFDADARKKLMFCGLGVYRDGASGGTDSNNSATYTPNAADSFGQGAGYSVSQARVHFTIRSALAGIQLRQSDESQTVSRILSSGAAFTGSVSSTILTASAVSGLIASRGARVFGGVSVTTVVTSRGASTYGGAGTYSLNNSQTVASQAMTTDPNIDPTLNVPQVATMKYDPAKNQSLQVLGAYGDVVVSGVEHYNDHAGVTVSNIAMGGLLAYQLATCDDGAMRRHFENLQFDLVIFVLGMNDRTWFSADFYAANMARLISQAQACSRTKVIVVRQTDAAPGGTNYMGDYTSALQNLALAKGCGFYDMRSASPSLADYATASAAGLMYDGVHLAPDANTMVGNDLAARLISTGALI